MDQIWKEFFEQKSSWSHGPTYDLTLLARAQASNKDFDKALINECGLEVWKGSIDRGVKSSILYLGEDRQPVGLFHSYLKDDNQIASMQLSVYPAQMSRIINTPERFRQLHLSLIDLTRKVSKKLPVLCATIGDETHAYVYPPEEAGRNICFTKNSWQEAILGLPSKEMKHPWEGYFAVALDG